MSLNHFTPSIDANIRLSRGDGGNNPGNNLHVSGLSHKVDSRDLETLFAKHGRVSLVWSGLFYLPLG